LRGQQDLGEGEGSAPGDPWECDLQKPARISKLHEFFASVPRKDEGCPSGHENKEKGFTLNKRRI